MQSLLSCLCFASRFDFENVNWIVKYVIPWRLQSEEVTESRRYYICGWFGLRSEIGMVSVFFSSSVFFPKAFLNLTTNGIEAELLNRNENPSCCPRWLLLINNNYHQQASRGRLFKTIISFHRFMNTFYSVVFFPRFCCPIGTFQKWPTFRLNLQKEPVRRVNSEQ